MIRRLGDRSRYRAVTVYTRVAKVGPMSRDWLISSQGENTPLLPLLGLSVQSLVRRLLLAAAQKRADGVKPA